MGSDDGRAFWWRLAKLRVRFFDDEWRCCLVGLVALEGLGELLFHFPRATIVRVGEEFTFNGNGVETLSGFVVFTFTWSLSDYLSPEIAFGIFLLTLGKLIDGDRDKLGLKQGDDFWIGKGRRTVEDTIISGAS